MGTQWTFVSGLPIMKKINHLGVNNRVLRCLESTSSLPQTDLPGQATSLGPLQVPSNLRGVEGGQSL